MRASLLTLIAATGSALGVLAACSSPAPDTGSAGGSSTTGDQASVNVTMLDSAGNPTGSCSGTLVSERLVLTSGHCTVSAASWSVSSLSANKQVKASRAVTPWENFKSSWSHPNHSDIGLIVLNDSIKIDKYPSIATSQAADGAKAMRFKRSSTNSDIAGSSITLTKGSEKGFALNYLAEVEKGEWIDTGGAVMQNGKILGVVSGVGNKTGMLHIARTDNFAKWITSAMTCSSTLKVQYGSGGGSGSGGGGNGWGGSTGGSGSGSGNCEGSWGAGNGSKAGSGDSPWGASGNLGGGGWGNGGGGGWGGMGGNGGCNGDWGGYGGSGSSTVDAGTTVPGSGGDGGLADGGTNGDNGTNSGSGSTGNTGTPDDNGNVGGNPGGGDAPTCPGTPTCSGEDCPNGDSTTPSNSGSGNTGNPGGTPGTSGDGTPGSDVPDQCQGPQDNPDSCPPDTKNCQGAGCGGCAGIENCQDGVIDMGAAARGNGTVIH